MKTFCKFKEVEVSKDSENPYENDLLNRSISGKVLQAMVELYGGFVLAINGKWGSGKTTFIQMWKKQMEIEGYTVLSYNAWEIDYIEDPLIGLIAEFKKNTAVGEDKVMKFNKAISRISFSIVPALLSMTVKHFTGIDVNGFEKVVKDGSEEVVNLLNESVDKFFEQQESIKEFKKILQEFAIEISPDKPIIFIIDELDRCKPDFAVKTLERIKHLFTVENVVFVLAIDREQLGHSIRGYYGSDLINADDYLRRFIDVQYDLPVSVPTVDVIVDSAIKRFKFDDSKIFNPPIGDKENLVILKKIMSSICNSQNLSIRQLEKWMIQTRLIIDHAQDLNLFPFTLAFIVYLRYFDSNFYEHLMNLDISDQEILDQLTKYFKHSSFEKGILTGNVTLLIIAQILKIKYSDNVNMFHGRIYNPTISDPNNSNGKLLLNLDNDFDTNKLCEAFKVLENRSIPDMFNIQLLLS